MTKMYNLRASSLRVALMTAAAGVGGLTSSSVGVFDAAVCYGLKLKMLKVEDETNSLLPRKQSNTAETGCLAFLNKKLRELREQSRAEEIFAYDYLIEGIKTSDSVVAEVYELFYKITTSSRDIEQKWVDVLEMLESRYIYVGHIRSVDEDDLFVNKDAIEEHQENNSFSAEDRKMLNKKVKKHLLSLLSWFRARQPSYLFYSTWVHAHAPMKWVRAEHMSDFQSAALQVIEADKGSLTKKKV